MNNEQQIKQLEECNQELQKQERLLRAQIELQAKQIEELKASSAKSDEDRFGPYKGPGAYIDNDGAHHCGRNDNRETYYAYPTREQAEWEFKATQVRRKLQRICAVLGPAGSGEGYCVAIPISPHSSQLVGSVYFARQEYGRQAEEILGDDLRYLDWNNSPEAMVNTPINRNTYTSPDHFIGYTRPALITDDVL